MEYLNDKWRVAALILVIGIIAYQFTPRFEINQIGKDMDARMTQVERTTAVLISVGQNDLIWQTENCGAAEFCWGPRHAHDDVTTEDEG